MTAAPERREPVDVAIVGGGMVGVSLACALAPLPLRVAVIEGAMPKLGQPPCYDDRAIALSYGSRRILESIGVWSHLEACATPIEHIHISDRGRFGFARLDRDEEGVEALGYVVLAREIGEALYGALAETGVELIAPASVESFSQEEGSVHLLLDEEGGSSTLDARLMVAADGTHSQAREALGIAAKGWSYEQTAVVTNVTPSRPHGLRAFERFTEDGPLALLPMTENRCGLVWTQRHDRVEEVMGWNDAEFLARLQDAFGFRLGRFVQVGQRHAYPLQLLMAERAVAGRVALIGNAMHTLHPIAGQGFNLGIRDVAALADVIADAVQRDGDPGAPEVLDHYARWRDGDQKSLAVITDALARVFGNPLPPVRTGRNLGLLLTDLAPGLRHRIARHAMGLEGRLPRLSRGVSLG